MVGKKHFAVLMVLALAAGCNGGATSQPPGPGKIAAGGRGCACPAHAGGGGSAACPCLVPGEAELAAGVSLDGASVRFDGAFLGELRDLEAALKWAGVEPSRSGDALLVPADAKTREALAKVAARARDEMTVAAPPVLLGAGAPGSRAACMAARLAAVRTLAARAAAVLAGGSQAAAGCPREITIAAAMPFAAKHLEGCGVKVAAAPGSLVIHVSSREETLAKMLGTLEALRRRMALIGQNVARAEMTRASTAPDGKPVPYRRQILDIGAGGSLSVVDDPSQFRRVYKPDHRDKDAEGYVLFPNVYPEVEREELRSTLREYRLLARAVSVLRPDLIVPEAEEPPAPGGN